MGYVNDDDWARDIAQETFITVWQQLPKFRNECAIGTWIYRIAANNCLRQIERSKRMPAGNFPEQLPETPSHDTEAQVALLYRCISELPETDRIIISLELDDLKQAEIAAVVGISEGNVRVRVHRIKEKLLQKMTRYEP